MASLFVSIPPPVTSIAWLLSLWERTGAVASLRGKGNQSLSRVSQALETRRDPRGRAAEQRLAKIAIAVQDSKAEVYWNEAKLPGGPFPIERVQSGFIAVYANFVGGLGHAETKIDGLRVWLRK
jgi:hypothetical protein